MSVQKVLVCSLTEKQGHHELVYCPWGLENIAQVLGNRVQFCQNQDARKAVSATLSVLK